MSGPKMPWFKFHSTAPDDEKVHALTGELGDAGADVYLYRLWAFCGRKKPNGRFAKAAAVSVIESSVGWRGERGRLVDVLLRVGLLDDVGDEYEVHKWPEYQAALVERFEKDKKRPTSTKRPQPARTGFVEMPARANSETPRGVSPISPLSSSKGVQGEADESPLIERMCVAFHRVRGAMYALSHHDDAAMRRLLGLARGDEGEVLRRWGIALAWRGFPTCASLQQLAQHWNNYAQPQPAAPGKPQQASGYVKTDNREWTEEESNGVF
jgi:hypothetical protein